MSMIGGYDLANDEPEGTLKCPICGEDAPAKDVEFYKSCEGCYREAVGDM
jgi:hypothetical protein